MLHVTRTEYEAKQGHDYAGVGTPLEPDARGHWMMGYEVGVGTVLRTCLEILDTQDEQILAERVAELDAVPSIRCGDYIRFADGVERRVSHVWDWGDGDEPQIQTSKGGSWYLGHGYTSFSGGLFPAVPASTLTRTEETKQGSCWFFHHDYHTAHNGVDVEIAFRVYRCSERAPS